MILLAFVFGVFISVPVVHTVSYRQGAKDEIAKHTVGTLHAGESRDTGESTITVTEGTAEVAPDEIWK